jgi:hypothetical protein
VQGTFFVTHPSDVIADLARDGHHVGIHPNFLPKSSQGDSVEEIVEYLLRIAPSAVAMRTHALVQSTPLLGRVFGSFPQLRYDLSMFMYGFPHVQAFDWTLEKTRFTRVNYNWEDDVAFFDGNLRWDTPTFYGPTCVFDFHPIHVALNSRDASSYGKLKQSMSGRPLWQASPEQVRSAANPGQGAHDFLHALLASDAQPLTFEELLA